MIPPILNVLSSFSWRFETGIISVLLFGEFPYPEEEAEEN